MKATFKKLLQKLPVEQDDMIEQKTITAQSTLSFLNA